jgi:hypothetical protein
VSWHDHLFWHHDLNQWAQSNQIFSQHHRWHLWIIHWGQEHEQTARRKYCKTRLFQDILGQIDTLDQTTQSRPQSENNVEKVSAAKYQCVALLAIYGYLDVFVSATTAIDLLHIHRENDYFSQRILLLQLIPRGVSPVLVGSNLTSLWCRTTVSLSCLVYNRPAQFHPWLIHIVNLSTA